MFNRQQEEMFLPAPIPKLGAIRILFPPDAAQQFPVGGMESDEVTSTAMIGTEDKLLRRQLPESALDVGCPKPRAIPTECDDFVVAELEDSFDRVLKTRREIPAGLPMNVWAGGSRISG